MEIYAIAMFFGILAYCIGSLVTYREPFNMERMLHRGKYAENGQGSEPVRWTLRKILTCLVGITPDYSRSDKAIAWGTFLWSVLYKFLFMFVFVVVANFISPWKLEWWGHYFLLVSLLVPGVISIVTTIWFANRRKPSICSACSGI